MKWRVVEQRVWEVEAESREDALKVFDPSSPPGETNLYSEDWWTEDRCESLAGLIRSSLEKRIGVCKDSFYWDEFGPWINKAEKVLEEVLGCDLIARSLDGEETHHDGRWRTTSDPLVGVWLFEGENEDSDNAEWSVTMKESVALKILVLGGF